MRRSSESNADERAFKLSQYDHCTGTCTKKRLSERWRVLGDGSGVRQRDVNCRIPGRLASCAIAARSCGMGQATTGEYECRSSLTKAATVRLTCILPYGYIAIWQ